MDTYSDSPAEGRKERLARKAARKERRAARKDARGKGANAAKLRDKAAGLKKKASMSRTEAKIAKKSARNEKKVARIEKRNSPDAKAKRKKIGKKILRGAAAVATGGKSEIARAGVKGVKKLAKKVKAKKDAGKAKRQATMAKAKGKAKTAVASTRKKVGAAVAGALPSPAMYDGPGGQETPKLGRMSMGPGMYGKGSKISYGNYSKPGYAKGSGTQHSGSPFNMNSANKIHKHMKGKK